MRKTLDVRSGVSRKERQGAKTQRESRPPSVLSWRPFAALRLCVKSVPGFAALVLCASVVIAAVPSDVEKLLEKHLKARGGMAAYQHIKVRRTLSVVKINNQEVKTTSLETPPDGRFYQVLEIPQIGKVEAGYDGRKMWQRSKDGQGEIPLDDPRARAMRKASTAAEFWDYKKDERRFRYGGKEKLEGNDYEVLETTFTLQNGKDVPSKYYFDAAGLLKVIVAGEDGGTRLDFSDYRAVDGIQYPFLTKFTGPGSAVETVVTEIKHNTPLDTSVFTYKEAIGVPPIGVPPPLPKKQ